ncbi:response regulator transcription factor [Paenibacillus sp. JDR-2]|uniref:response regulator transcription factor n=1 Tax=Paenibacillus sp. (strain JDR-2) TaxID=324057 RepID=UPI00016665ED|nr:response regulator [Paenibacillus sp. JDR-2]ACT02242.1 two component transcriptional regulator, AraC family [Paenibacillus sp. JDR-2]
MYRVLIVDDEPWVAYGISKLIDWETEGYQVIGQAYDGSSALRFIEEHRPEVVVSDIRMPGLNGIELLNEIAKQKLGTEVILASGYSEFEYAQQALRLGAFDYLLKQIEKEQLLETIMRLRGHLEQKKLDAGDPDAPLNDLFELLDADGNTTIGQYLCNRGMKPEHSNVLLINAVFWYATVTDSSERVAKLSGMDAHVMRTGSNKLSYILLYDEAAHSADLLDFITGNLKDASHIGISMPSDLSYPLSKVFHAADIALFTSCFYPDHRIVRYKEHEATAAGISGTMLQLELSMKERKLTGMQECLQRLMEQCRGMQLDQFASVYNQIISLIHKYYSQASSQQDIEFLTCDQLARIYSSIDAVFERLKNGFELEGTPDLPVISGQVKAVMDYIDTSFTEDIMLGAIAKRFNLSLSYLSFLIKKEAGTSYSDYITGKRIALAKELLKESSISVHEVVERVGYKDYFHFNKLFKKHVGLTPSKFRKI